MLYERTLGQWLEHWAATTPDKEYIVYSDRNLRFTWSQFNRRVDDMAKGLIAIGVERGTHVGIWAANVPDWLTLLYACAKIGAVYVTVNTNYKERCTALYGVPTMFIAELHHPMFDLFDMSCLRTGIMAGSLCPVELMKQVEEKMYMKVTSVYGLTEAAPGMTATRIDDPFDVRCNTVGRDFEHTEVKVIDPETGEECPTGVQGEMCNRGYNTMKGYYKNPQATAEVIDKNGFLHSGDLGVKDEDGNYRITGRIKDMIIRGGENIYPREIEEFLYQLEGVKDVQVAGIPSKKYGEAVGAFIIQHEGADLHESDVRDFCIGKISRYKIPKYIFFVKEFPMTGSGKIQKFKLKDLGLQLCKEQGIEII